MVTGLISPIGWARFDEEEIDGGLSVIGNAAVSAC